MLIFLMRNETNSLKCFVLIVYWISDTQKSFYVDTKKRIILKNFFWNFSFVRILCKIRSIFTNPWFSAFLNEFSIIFFGKDKRKRRKNTNLGHFLSFSYVFSMGILTLIELSQEMWEVLSLLYEFMLKNMHF